MKRWWLALIAGILMGLASVQAEEIVLWHSLQGPLEKALQRHVKNFEERYPNTHIRLVFKGNYTETFNAFLEEKTLPPHLVLASEYHAETMRRMTDRYIPVSEVLPLGKTEFAPYVRDYYSNEAGKMLALPFNVSAGVLYYNKQAFRKAGLDPNTPPQTWEEVEMFSRKLKKAGYVGFSTAWPSAYILEHYAATHGIPLTTNENGFTGDPHLTLTHPELIKQLAWFVKMARQGLYQYGGRYSDAEKLFTEGTCAMFLQGANRASFLMTEGTFDAGVGSLPYNHRLVKAPYALSVGGASLWIVASPQEMSVARREELAKFLSHLVSLEVQAAWFHKTHYLPVTRGGIAFVREEAQKDPALLKEPGYIALEEVTRASTIFSKGLRIPSFAYIRARIIDYIEDALSGKLRPEQALKEAEEKGNQHLELGRF